MNAIDTTAAGRGRRPLALLALLLLLGSLCLTPLALADEISISGIIEPYQDVALGIAATGRVAKIHVAEGAWVKKGAVILELDKRVEELEVERRKLIWQSKVEVESAAKQVKTLELHLKTSRELFTSTGSVNREELEKQELEFTQAKAELERLESSEAREEVEYNIAREQLANRILRAPFSGAIAELMVGTGDKCEVDKPLARLVDTSRGILVANLEMGALGQLKVGKAVDVQLQIGGEGVSLPGEISFISPVVDPASGLRKVKAVFSAKNRKIVPGVAGAMLVTLP